jgi:hypothetical protein
MWLPKVRLIACTDMNFNYCYKDGDTFKNIVDHPLVDTSVRTLDRTIFRNFLMEKGGSIAACGPQVKEDIGKNLASSFNLMMVGGSVASVYFHALAQLKNIVVLGGARTYHEWLMSGFVDEIYIHQLSIFPSNDTEMKSIEPNSGFFEDHPLEVVGSFGESRLLKGTKK